MSNDKEYTLDFFEAMAALKEGKKVESICSATGHYEMHSGQIVFFQGGKILNTPIYPNELKAKWRIVEPEPEKCWLDERIHF